MSTSRSALEWLQSDNGGGVAAIDAAIDALITAPTRDLDLLEPRAEVLLEQVRDACRGGKRVRGMLLLQAHHLLQGAHPADAVQLAAACELLHAAFLLHDDVIHGDWVRRGRRTLGAVYRDSRPGPAAQRIGVAAGIVGGDFTLHLAHRALRTAVASLPAGVGSAIVQEFDRALFLTAVGEIADFEEEQSRDADPALSEEISFAKTAAYTFQAPLVIGALLAGATDETIEALRAFGASAGTAFQLTDDLIGTFDPEGASGKSTTSDPSRRKYTLLMVMARRAEVVDLDERLAEAQASGDFRRVQSLLHDSGARAALESRIEALRSRSIAECDPVPAPLRDLLAAVATAGPVAPSAAASRAPSGVEAAG